MEMMLLWLRFYLQEYEKFLVESSGLTMEEIDCCLQENGYFRLDK